MRRIQFISNIGFIVLAIFLILTGIALLVPNFVISGIILGIVAIVAGILILLGI